MNNFQKNNPRRERPYRKGKFSRRNQLESKEQDNLRTERIRKNRAERQFGRMENRGRARHQHDCMAGVERPRRLFGWRTEEHIYHAGEVPFEMAGFRQRANRPLHKGERWAVRPRRGEPQTPKHTNRHCWSWRPRHADEFRREDGEFHNCRIREHAHQSQPIQQRHPSHILREKWMLEEKLFRITRRIQRLNRQLRG